MPEPDTGWSIEVDRTRCMGTGTCLVYAPGTLGLDAEGKADVRHPITDDLAAAQNAVEACPTEALSISGAGR
jgi:ferredoxin